MNKFDNYFNRYMEHQYTSMCLNEYVDDDDDEEDPEAEALAAATSAAATPADAQTQDQKTLAKTANKFNAQAARTLSKGTSNLKKRS